MYCVSSGVLRGRVRTRRQRRTGGDGSELGITGEDIGGRQSSGVKADCRVDERNHGEDDSRLDSDDGKERELVRCGVSGRAVMGSLLQSPALSAHLILRPVCLCPFFPSRARFKGSGSCSGRRCPGIRWVHRLAADIPGPSCRCLSRVTRQQGRSGRRSVAGVVGIWWKVAVGCALVRSARERGRRRGGVRSSAGEEGRR